MVMGEDATFAVAEAVSTSVSVIELAPDGVVIGFADHAAVTPLGKPVMLHVMFPANDPAVEAVKFNFSVPPSASVAKLEVEVNASVGV